MSDNTKKKINWPLYNRELINRGSITLWMAPGFQKKWYNKLKTGERGASNKYASEAVKVVALLKNRYQLPLRGIAGFTESLFELLGLDLEVPDYSTICRRLKENDLFSREILNKEPLHVVIDSTGLKVYGEGEWKVRIHGYSKRRTWRKLHLAVDEKTNQILGMILTGNDIKDSQVTADLLEQIPEEIDQVSADGAYDSENVYAAVEARGGITVVPPKEGAVIHQHGNTKGKPPELRDEHVRHIRKNGKTLWKIDLKYTRRSLAETAMFRFKKTFGGSLSSRIVPNQIAESAIKCEILNKFKTPSIL